MSVFEMLWNIPSPPIFWIFLLWILYTSIQSWKKVRQFQGNATSRHWISLVLTFAVLCLCFLILTLCIPKIMFISGIWLLSDEVVQLFGL
jgi:hypothetical protein